MPTTVLRYYALSVFALCKHCSGNSDLVIFQFRTVATIPGGTIATVVTVFFGVFRLYFFFFPFIYIVLLYNKFHNIFTIIELSISYKSK